jgi:hypothetical protein
MHRCAAMPPTRRCAGGIEYPAIHQRKKRILHWSHRQTLADAVASTSGQFRSFLASQVDSDSRGAVAMIKSEVMMQMHSAILLRSGCSVVDGDRGAIPLGEAKRLDPLTAPHGRPQAPREPGWTRTTTSPSKVWPSIRSTQVRCASGTDGTSLLR